MAADSCDGDLQTAGSTGEADQSDAAGRTWQLCLGQQD
jgi:hypothetical protein